MVSALQETLSKVCCCLDIEIGAFLLGITRILNHLIKIMIGIVIIWGGIIEGVDEPTTIKPIEESGTVTAAPDDAATTTQASGGENVTETDSTTESGLRRKIAQRSLMYGTDREITKAEMEEMSIILRDLAIVWISYYAVYLVISFIYTVGLKLDNWMLMSPMVVMSVIDIFAPPFLYSIGIIFAYMMNDPYKKPAITLSIIYESACAIFGLYVFTVVWASWIAIKNKSTTKPRSHGAQTLE